MDEAKENVIAVKKLTTRLGGRTIHRDLDLEVRRGEVMGLIGSSGGGKTVLMQHIMGLLKPVSGSIELFGEAIEEMTSEEFRHIALRWGVLFQQGALFSALTVFDNIAFPFRELKKYGEGVDDDTMRQLVFLKLKMAGLEAEDAWKYPAELSGGMVKRAALARALALDAELLFLDEPTSGLDPIRSAEFDSLLLELRQEMRLSALLVTHDLDSLALLCDRISILDEGKVLATGTLEEVARMDHPFVKDFFKTRPGEKRLRSIQH